MIKVGEVKFQYTHPYRVWRLQLNTTDNLYWFQYTHPYRVWPSVAIPLSSWLVFQYTHPYRVWRYVIIIRLLVRCFNTHTHTGCDWIFFSFCILLVCFNTHTHTGCDDVVFSRTTNDGLFQYTHPYRVWRHNNFLTLLQGKFQYTHPYRVWHFSAFDPETGKMFQYTHPYRVWPFSSKDLQYNFVVSIHTPIQGVTVYVIKFYESIYYRSWNANYDLIYLL